MTSDDFSAFNCRSVMATSFSMLEDNSCVSDSSLRLSIFNRPLFLFVGRGLICSVFLSGTVE